MYERKSAEKKEEVREPVTPAGKALQDAWDAVIEARSKANSAQASKAGKSTLAAENEFRALKAKAEAEGKKVSINEFNQISVG